MLHVADPSVRKELLCGTFGLELESLRIDSVGRLSQTEHPFPGNARIDRDFSENQTEFNTEVCENSAEATKTLRNYYAGALKQLRALPEAEYFWPFSNPPALYGDADIPVAQYFGELRQKTEYRNYLSDRYGRYKMTFSGIHVNFSFSEELIEAEAAVSGMDRRAVKDQLYLELAEKTVAHGWVLTAVTAASPILDSSFHDAEQTGTTDFSGMASVRCSELGYWNFFSPVLCYDSVQDYIDSVQRYVDRGMLRQFSELYYPVRLKSKGIYSLSGLVEKGINHIELRMFDLNPLVFGGLDERDVEFAQLLLVWLAAGPRDPLSENEQVQAVQNFKSAAHYNLDAVRLPAKDGTSKTVRAAAIDLIHGMQDFYREAPAPVQEILNFELNKLLKPENSYAAQVRRLFGSDYMKKGLALAKQRSAEAERYLADLKNE